MGILKLLRPVILDGQVVTQSQTIRVEDEEWLLDAGIARRLTSDETRVILDGYIEYAETLFNDESKPSQSHIKHYEQGCLNLGRG